MQSTSAPHSRLAARRQFLSHLAMRRSQSVPASGQDDYWIRIHRRAMACRFEITLAAADRRFVPAAAVALDQIDELEDELSLFRETSTIAEVNRLAAGRAVPLPRHVIDLLLECQRLHAETRGAFDITSTPLSRCWGFLRREGCVPADDVIAAARTHVGFDAVQLNTGDQTVRFARQGIELNLGAVGKGYALDRAAGLVRQSGVRHALLSAGGSSLLAVGGRGTGWQVDLISPLVARRRLGALWLRDAALGTSGSAEQFVVSGGRRYGHVIDPRTGWPATGTVSASVVASSAARADALSTAFLIGGLELAERYCSEHPDVLAIVTPDDGAGRPVKIGSHPGAEFVEQ